MTTIRKNSKRFNELKENTNWVMLSLANSFQSEAYGAIAANERGKMTEDDKTVTFSVHSNLWFELRK